MLELIGILFLAYVILSTLTVLIERWLGIEPKDD
jgi:hypothetical protein